LGWLAVPVIGLHSSLRFRTFSMALAVSWFWAFGAPALASVVVMFSVSAGLNRMARGDEPMVAGIFAWVCVQLAVAGLHWAALHQGLVRREFRMGMGRWD
jgi:hypothetical protein